MIAKARLAGALRRSAAVYCRPLQPRFRRGIQRPRATGPHAGNHRSLVESYNGLGLGFGELGLRIWGRFREGGPKHDGV